MEGRETQENTVRLADFLDEYRDQIAQSVIKSYPPFYSFGDRKQHIDTLKRLKRTPYLSQLDAISALAKLFKTDDSGVLVGEMGTGKTLVAVVLAYVCGFKRVLVTAPPHLCAKWAREATITLPEGSIECHQLKRFTDLDRSAECVDNGNMHLFILGRERAKLSYQWRPAYNKKMHLVERANGDHEKVAFVQCPDCGKLVVDNEGIPILPSELGKKKKVCQHCESPLWQAKRNGPRRLAVGEYIKRKYRGFFDLYVADEVHEMKGRASSQGIMGGILASCCEKTLAMTGTIFGGYSSSLFHLLYRFTRRFKDDYEHSHTSKWIDHYGIWEKVTKYDGGDAYDDNIMSRGRKYRCAPREKPGISPVVLPKYLLDKTVFIRLSDIAIDLPPLEEEIVHVDMTEEQDEAYQILYRDLRAALLEELRKGSKSLLAIYLQSLLTYPDRCTVGEMVYDKHGDLVAEAPALNPDILYPKEQELIDIIKKEKASGRRVLVYCTHTQIRDITERLQQAMEKSGIRAEVLKPSVPSEKREAWIQKHAVGLDCLITNPKLVQTGLDLVEFPTLVFHEVEYSVYTLRQASRRSWRIGQDLPVKVYYLIYGNTMQEQALKLVALKIKTSLAIEGELGDDGLATYNVGDENLFYELARNIANNVQLDKSLDSMWQEVQTQEKKSGATDLLIESLDEYQNMPDLNGVLKRAVSEIKEQFNPELWDELYKIRIAAKPKRRKRKVSENQIALFAEV